MNTRRNASKIVREIAAGGKQAPPRAPATGVEVPVKPATLVDGEVRETLFQMAKAVTAQEQAITTHDTREKLLRRTHMLAPWLED